MEIDLSRRRGKRNSQDYSVARRVRKPRRGRVSVSGILQIANNVKRALSNALFWGRGSAYRWVVQGGFVILLIGFFIPYTSGEEVVMGASGVAEEEIHFDFGGDVLAADVMYEFSGGKTVIPADRPEYNIRTYVVQSGDTLSSIALKFNLSVDTLRWANSIYSDNIRPGDKLQVPPVDGVLHKVKEGESLASISDKYDLEGGEQTIVDWNLDLEPPYTLKEGMILFVPGAKGTTPQPITSSSSSYSSSPYSSSSGGISLPSNPGTFIEPVAGAVGYLSRGYYSYHRALDISVRGGGAPDIVATAAGRVIYSGYKSGGCGYGVWIDHGNSFVSHYCHMSSLYVRSGTSVSQGTRIGRMGSTGRSTGTHVHFVLEYKGVPIDPRRYMTI